MLYQLLVELMKGNETRCIIQLLLQNDMGSSQLALIDFNFLICLSLIHIQMCIRDSMMIDYIRLIFYDLFIFCPLLHIHTVAFILQLNVPNSQFIYYFQSCHCLLQISLPTGQVMLSVTAFPKLMHILLSQNLYRDRVRFPIFGWFPNFGNGDN